MTKAQKAKKARDSLESSLKGALESKDLREDFYTEFLNQYMTFYDSFLHLNGLKQYLEHNEAPGYRAYTDITAELRRISSQMLDIINKLGLKPPEGMGSAPTEL